MPDAVFNDPPYLLLAPMAGISNQAFRLMAKKFGARLVCTEMISAEGIVRGNPKTGDLIDISPLERPVSIQLFGNDADVLARAARIVEFEADVIDINFGCPARKVVRSGSGGALLRQPEAVGNIIEKVVNAVSCPVTAKIRSGWDEETINACEVARIAEKAGASAVIVHPRTRNQGFSGRADWGVIAAVKDMVSIPVIGNGDVNVPEDVKNMLELTGCDGVMIGRGAMGNPWIFSRSVQYLETGILPPPPDATQKLMNLLEFAASLVALKGEHVACREIRKFVKPYTAGMSNAKEFRQAAVHVETFSELESAIMSYIGSCPEVVKDGIRCDES